MPICPSIGACRCVTSGLPYWPRLKLYMNASYVPWLSVQSHLKPARQAVGSPSLIEGLCAARIGCVRKGEPPSTIAPKIASSSFQRRIVFGRRISTATATAGPASIPAMWFA